MNHVSFTSCQEDDNAKCGWARANCKAAWSWRLTADSSDRWFFSGSSNGLSENLGENAPIIPLLIIMLPMKWFHGCSNEWGDTDAHFQTNPGWEGRPRFYPGALQRLWKSPAVQIYEVSNANEKANGMCSRWIHPFLAAITDWVSHLKESPNGNCMHKLEAQDDHVIYQAMSRKLL